MQLQSTKLLHIFHSQKEMKKKKASYLAFTVMFLTQKDAVTATAAKASKAEVLLKAVSLVFTNIDNLAPRDSDLTLPQPDVLRFREEEEKHLQCLRA